MKTAKAVKTDESRWDDGPAACVYEAKMDRVQAVCLHNR